MLPLVRKDMDMEKRSNIIHINTNLSKVRVLLLMFFITQQLFLMLYITRY